MKPTTLLALFNTPQLKGVAQEVEDTIVKIMKEAVDWLAFYDGTVPFDHCARLPGLQL